MSPWAQNLLVLLAVGASAVYLFRGVFRALHGRKSRIGGCGVCTGCATPEPPAKAAGDRIVMVPMDALVRSSKNRPATIPNTPPR